MVWWCLFRMLSKRFGLELFTVSQNFVYFYPIHFTQPNQPNTILTFLVHLPTFIRSDGVMTSGRIRPYTTSSPSLLSLPLYFRTLNLSVTKEENLLAMPEARNAKHTSTIPIATTMNCQLRYTGMQLRRETLRSLYEKPIRGHLKQPFCPILGWYDQIPQGEQAISPLCESL